MAWKTASCVIMPSLSVSRFGAVTPLLGVARPDDLRVLEEVLHLLDRELVEPARGNGRGKWRVRRGQERRGERRIRSGTTSTPPIAAGMRCLRAICRSS